VALQTAKVTVVGRARPLNGSPTLTIKRASSADPDEWDDYVRRAPDGTFCHLWGWGRVIEQTWGHRSHSLYAERGGAIVGLLPQFHMRSRLFGSMLVSTPNAIYGGALADDSATRRALIDEAKQLAMELQVDYLELRDSQCRGDEAADGQLHSKDLYVTFERSITNDEEALLGSYPKKIRYLIRKAWQAGLTSQLGRAELLDAFYDVYASNMRNLGTPVYPKRLFAEFLRQFPDSCDILVVRQGRRVAGAAMSFYFRDVVLPHYAAAHRDFYPAGVSTFMFSEVMRRAAARGCRRFDFGRSKLGSGSCAFKRGWRAAERPLPYKYFLARATQVPRLDPTNPKFDLMIKFWKHLPVGVTKLLGPMIVKYIP
jgi:FemAB-related protein (PEP-CTERM system-associated)